MTDVGEHRSPDVLETYASIRERDTDLVLVMALRASPEVRGLFLRAVTWDDDRLLSVAHSYSTADGREVDVQAVFGSPDSRRILHVENKIDAVFQPGQAFSYHQRVVQLREQEDVLSAASLLKRGIDLPLRGVVM